MPRPKGLKYKTMNRPFGLKYKKMDRPTGLEYKKKSESKQYPGLKRGSPEYVKAAFLRHMYGISMDEYNDLFEKQKGCCAICKKHQTEIKKRLHVDHCHTTGKVRGLLCFSCNNALGQLNDDIELLKAAITYLVI